jgi:ABC-type transport system substrate-binding protein
LDGTVLTELIGTGPFIFRESRTGEYVHMTRNEHYMLFKTDPNAETSEEAVP